MLVEFFVVRVHEFDVLQSFVFGYEAVADDLDLGLMRYSLEIWMKDAAFCVEGFSVTIALSRGVESVSQFILSSRRTVCLVFEHDYMVSVQSLADEGEFVVCNKRISILLKEG